MDRLEQTCCFTGHRALPKDKLAEIENSLENTIVDLIENKGVLYFGAGGALGFDMLASQVVLRLKKKYENIRLILVLPCKNHFKMWSLQQQLQFKLIQSKADKIVYASEKYTSYCMHQRNRHLVDNSKYCVCYCHENKGGTVYTVNYAREKERVIIEI